MTAPLCEIARMVVVAALCVPAFVAWAAEPLTCSAANSAEAIRVLRAKIRSERLYVSWAKEQCLEFYPEHCDPMKVDIAIRELHTEECGGAPQTGPVVDRFRVYRKSKNINWYDVVNDEYLEFSKVHSMGKR